MRTPEPQSCVRSETDRDKCETHWLLFGGAGSAADNLYRQPLIHNTDSVLCVGAIEDALDDCIEDATDRWMESRAAVIRLKRKGESKKALDREFTKSVRLGETVNVLTVLRDVVGLSLA